MAINEEEEEEEDEVEKLAEAAAFQKTKSIAYPKAQPFKTLHCMQIHINPLLQMRQLDT